MSNSQFISELRNHLKLFSHASTHQPVDQTCKSALQLLRNVPASRLAVLEYFTKIYQLANYLHFDTTTANISNPEEINTLYKAIDDVHKSLIALSDNQTWSIELTTWAMDLIGIISKNVEAQIMKQQPQQQQSQVPIVEYLQFWSQVKPFKNLVDLCQICFTKSHAEAMEILFNALSRYGNSFDWSICYFGSVNPSETIKKILFIMFKEYIDMKMQNVISPRFLSFIAIINHFSNVFKLQLRTAIDQFYEDFLDDDYRLFNQYGISNDQTRLFIFTFLIKIVQSSPNVLFFFASSVRIFFSKSNLIKIATQTKYLSALDLKNLSTDLRLLLKQFNLDVMDIFNYLVELASDNALDLQISKFIQSFIQDFLDESLLSFMGDKDKIPFVEALKTEYKYILNEILYENNQNEIRKQFLLDLLVLIGVQGPENITNSIMSHLLITKHDNLSVLLKYRQEVELLHSTCTRDSINSLLCFLRSNKSYDMFEQKNIDNQIAIDLTFNNNELKQFLKNLIDLYNWECQNENGLLSLESILRESVCFTHLVSLLSEESSSILQFYQLIGLPPSLNPTESIQFSISIVRYFHEIAVSNAELDDKILSFKELNEIVKMALTSYPFIVKNIFLRTFVDSILKEDRKTPFNVDTKAPLKEDENSEISLFQANLDLKDNLSSNTNFKVTLHEKSGFLRAPKSLTKKQEDTYLLNYEFIQVLDIICTGNNTTNETSKHSLMLNKSYENELMVNLAHLVVEHLTKNMMDFQWPDEENLKAFIERDLEIKNKIEAIPLIWSILDFIAECQSAFIKCSPIIRSILSYLMIQWENYQEQPTTSYPKILETTLKLLNIINRANLLPVPLKYIVDIIPKLNTYETYTLLLVIWRYLKSQFQANSNFNIAVTKEKYHTEHLRNIFLRNINKLSDLYPKFFKNIYSISNQNQLN